MSWCEVTSSPNHPASVRFLLLLSAKASLSRRRCHSAAKAANSFALGQAELSVTKSPAGSCCRRLGAAELGHREVAGAAGGDRGSGAAGCAQAAVYLLCPCVCRVCMRVEIVSNVTLHYQGYNESLLKWI